MGLGDGPSAARAASRPTRGRPRSVPDARSPTRHLQVPTPSLSALTARSGTRAAWTSRAHSGGGPGLWGLPSSDSFCRSVLGAQASRWARPGAGWRGARHRTGGSQVRRGPGASGAGGGHPWLGPLCTHWCLCPAHRPNTRLACRPPLPAVPGGAVWGPLGSSLQLRLPSTGTQEAPAPEGCKPACQPAGKGWNFQAQLETLPRTDGIPTDAAPPPGRACAARRALGPPCAPLSGSGPLTGPGPPPRAVWGSGPHCRWSAACSLGQLLPGTPAHGSPSQVCAVWGTGTGQLGSWDSEPLGSRSPWPWGASRWCGFCQTSPLCPGHHQDPAPQALNRPWGAGWSADSRLGCIPPGKGRLGR